MWNIDKNHEYIQTNRWFQRWQQAFLEINCHDFLMLSASFKGLKNIMACNSEAFLPKVRAYFVYLSAWCSHAVSSCFLKVFHRILDCSQLSSFSISRASWIAASWAFLATWVLIRCCSMITFDDLCGVSGYAWNSCKKTCWDAKASEEKYMASKAFLPWHRSNL